LTLSDTHGRRIGYLRLSLTSACQMRCVYCRPSVLTDNSSRAALSAEHIRSIVVHLAQKHGLRKVRLTGGDPTARRDLLTVIEAVASVEQIEDLAMTTNGLTLAARARDYVAAGLRRVNVSLDSLDRETFARLTGVDGLSRVLRGIDAAMHAGLSPVRINTVVMRGENDHQLGELVDYAANIGADLRFIELMPMGPLAAQWGQRFVSEAEMRDRLAGSVTDWTPVPQHSDSARRYRVRTRRGKRAVVGFITPMSCNFCVDCNRLRLTANGDVYPCLMDEPRGNIRAAVVPRFSAQRFDQLLNSCLSAKAAEHPATGYTAMTVLGG